MGWGPLFIFFYAGLAGCCFGFSVSVGLLAGCGDLIALLSMALSGMLIPINAFPDWVQVIANFVPMYYGNRIFEGIMLKGYGIGDLTFEFAAIGGITALLFALAAFTVKDRIPA
jgi:ABC-type uncharacterized transport system permease subunit